MPRIAAGLFLDVVSVRVQRVQDITEADAKTEGVEQVEGGYMDYYAGPSQGMTARQSYATLWDSLNAARGYGWSVNPRVWVIEFRRVTAEPKRKQEEDRP